MRKYVLLALLSIGSLLHSAAHAGIPRKDISVPAEKVSDSGSGLSAGLFISPIIPLSDAASGLDTKPFSIHLYASMRLPDSMTSGIGLPTSMFYTQAGLFAGRTTLEGNNSFVNNTGDEVTASGSITLTPIVPSLQLVFTGLPVVEPYMRLNLGIASVSSEFTTSNGVSDSTSSMDAVIGIGYGVIYRNAALSSIEFILDINILNYMESSSVNIMYVSIGAGYRI